MSHDQNQREAPNAFSPEGRSQELNERAVGRGLSIGFEAVDRHADGPLQKPPVTRWIGWGCSTLDLAYSDLHSENNCR